LSVGSDAFLPKPVQAETLFELLQQHLHLEWLYEERGEHVEEEYLASLPMVLPSPDELAALYKLSLMGNIGKLRTRVAQLERSDRRLKPFVAEMQRLIKSYQLNKISEWLETYLE